MPRRDEYLYDPLNLDDASAAPSIPQTEAPRSFGGFRQFIQALQASASEQEGRKGSSRSWGVALLLSFLFNVVLVVALAQTYRNGSQSDLSLFGMLKKIGCRHSLSIAQLSYPLPEVVTNSISLMAQPMPMRSMKKMKMRYGKHAVHQD